MPDDSVVAVSIWNMCGGEIKWEALPVLCEIFGVNDPETLIFQMVAIRDKK